MKWVRDHTLIALRNIGFTVKDVRGERDAILDRALEEVLVKDEAHIVAWFKRNLTSAERTLYLNDMLVEYAQRLLRAQLVA